MGTEAFSELNFTPGSLPTACPCWRQGWEQARGSAGAQLLAQGMQGSCQILQGNWTP